MAGKLIEQSDFIGQLFMPQGAPKVGLIITPSSAGVQKCREIAYAQWFAEHGAICLIADGFAMAKIDQCLTDQSRLKDDDLLACSIKAGQWLKRHYPDIPLGIMGVSKGGWVALHAGLEIPWQEAFNFDFHISLSTPAASQMREPKAKGVPILMLLAENDDFTPMEYASAYARKIVRHNPDLQLEIEIMPGCHHAWESVGDPVWLADAQNYSGCLFWLKGYNKLENAANGKPLDMARPPECMKRGAHYGGGNARLFGQTCEIIARFIDRVCKTDLLGHSS